MEFQNLHILYVEDETRSRRVMRMIMDDLGVTELIMFEDSEDFEQRVHALVPKPDLIFLDIHVQPYDGFHMLAMLRRSASFDNTPIIAMTASVMTEEVEKLRTSGFDGCIAKPLDMESFPDAIQRILSGEHIWRIVS